MLMAIPIPLQEQEIKHHNKIKANLELAFILWKELII